MTKSERTALIELLMSLGLSYEDACKAVVSIEQA